MLTAIVVTAAAQEIIVFCRSDMQFFYTEADGIEANSAPTHPAGRGR
jgi:hypothetical protein